MRGLVGGNTRVISLVRVSVQAPPAIAVMSVTE